MPWGWSRSDNSLKSSAVSTIASTEQQVAPSEQNGAERDCQECRDVEADEDVLETEDLLMREADKAEGDAHP